MSKRELPAFADETFTTVPAVASYLLGRGSSRLELGAGVLLGRRKTEVESATIFDLTGVVGYRYMRPAGGPLFRIGLTPFFAFGDEETAYPDPGLFLSGGLSLGYTF